MSALVMLEEISMPKSNSYELAMSVVENVSKKELVNYVTEYITLNDYGYELMCIVENHKEFIPFAYRGTKFLKSELVEGEPIIFDVELLSTSTDRTIAENFAKASATDEVMDWVYDLYDSIEVNFPNTKAFCEHVNQLYTNVLFKICNAEGLVLDSFYDFTHNFSREQEVLINTRLQSFVVSKVTFINDALDHAGRKVELCEVEIVKVDI